MGVIRCKLSYRRPFLPTVYIVDVLKLIYLCVIRFCTTTLVLIMMTFSHSLPLISHEVNATKLAKPRVLCDRHRSFLQFFLLLILGILCLITLSLRRPL